MKQQDEETMTAIISATSEAFTMAMFQVKVFWVVMLCSAVVLIPTFQRSMLPPSSLHPNDGGCKDL
jgi:hypothetical protein